MLFEIPNRLIVEFFVKAQDEALAEIYEDGLTPDEFTREEMIELMVDRFNKGKFKYVVEGE